MLFRSACGSVHDRASPGPEQPCPLPKELWASLRKYPPDAQPFLSRLLDLDTLRYHVGRLRKGKATGRDGIPNEYFMFGPTELLQYYLDAANAFLSGSHPVPQDWQGGLVTLIPKVPGAMTMDKLRPIANLATGYKMLTSIINDRLVRDFEARGIWHPSQEGARRSRGTLRQVFKLTEMLEQGRREKTQAVLLQLDFTAAFTKVEQKVVLHTLREYGVPEPDVALIQRVHEGSWYSVRNVFGETAACDLQTGEKIGRAHV